MYESPQPTTSQTRMAADNSHPDYHFLNAPCNNEAQFTCSGSLLITLESNQCTLSCRLSTSHETSNIDRSALNKLLQPEYRSPQRQLSSNILALVQHILH